MRAVAAVAAIAGLACSGKAKVETVPPKPPLESYFPLASAAGAELCEGLTREIAERGSSTAGDDGTAVRKKVIISDLHLGPGEAGRRFDGLEDFHADAVFARFVTAHTAGRTDLIINGDFLEMWQVEGALGLLPEKDSAGARGPTRRRGQQGPAGQKQRSTTPRLGADQRASLAALELIISAHPTVFLALARFLAAGDNRLIIIPGNHDADLIWPAVQLRLARELGVDDLERLLFVSTAGYRHAGVHVEHGHRIDGANAHPSTGAPVALDSAGVCRLQSSWGQVFVAEFFNQLEREHPFVDNLYPESAALIWGMGDDAARVGAMSAALRFVDHLFSAQDGELNLAALRGAVTSALGSPYRGDKTSVLSALWDAIPTADRSWAALERILVDPAFASLRAGVIRAVTADGALETLSAIRAIDLDAVTRLGDLLISEPAHVAATELATYDNRLSVVVFGHSHLPGGEVETIEFSTTGLHVANTGAWVPVTRVADLKSRGVKWSDLSLADRALFPARFPALMIDVDRDGVTPKRPRIVHAR